MDPRILHMSTYLLKSSFQALDCIQKLLISQSALCSQSLGYPKLNPAFNMYQNDFAFSQGETSSSDTHEATPIDNTHSDVSDNSYDQVQIGGNYFNAQENFKMLSSLGSLINENREGLMRDSKKIHKESPSPSKNHKNLEAKQTDNFNTSKRQRWHEEEDTQLIALFAQHGPKWTVIASLMTGRTAKQIRDRYKNILRPDIKRNEWTQEEENLFGVLYAQYGNRWCKIAEHLPGRSENQVKNKFYSQRKNKEFQKISPSDESEDGLSKEASETKVEYENQ